MADGLTRLTPRTLTTDCYDALKGNILNLNLPPGTVLVEQQLAEHLGVSKTPVREAIAKLNGEGLVVTDGRRRSVVSGLTLKSIQDLYHSRVLIEPAIIRDVAHALEHSDFVFLYELVEQADSAAQAETPIEVVEANEEFHTYFVRKSENEYLTRIITDLVTHVRRVRAAIEFTEQQTGERIVEETGRSEHRRVVNLLESGETDAAAELMRVHILAFLNNTQKPKMQAALELLASPDEGTNK